MNLTAVATSGTQITLTWSASTDSTVTGYFIERCSGAGCSSFAQIATTNGTTYSDTGLTASTSYSYRVRASNTAGSLGPYSNVASATTLSASAISVTLSLASTSVQAGIGTQAFAATVTNDTQNKGVTWSLSGAGCSGTSCGTLSNATATSVTYAAPPSVPSPASVILTATSVADGTKNASATIAITAPVSVSVSPASAAVNASLTQQFTATVQNDSQNLGVNWSVNGVAGGNTAVGTVSSTGLYTAPAAVPASGVTVTATSVADATRSASASVTVLAGVSVSVSPSTASVQQSQSQGFTATVSNDPGSLGVTWSLSGTGCSGATCGTLGNVTTTSVTYTAPATLPSPATVTLTATSNRDGTKSNTATITLSAASAIVVTVSPATASVQAGIGTRAFAATLTNDPQSKGVTWSLSGAGCSGTSCGTLSNVTNTSATYNAPSNQPSPATVTVTATSVADTTKSASATISIAAPITVSVSPASAAVNASLTQQFTATVQNDSQNLGVKWSVNGVAGGNTAVGTVSSTGLYTAPAAVPASGVTVTATSVADATRSASASVTVLAGVSVSVSPSTASVQQSQSQGFTATVSNDPGSLGVTWSLSGTGCSGATCGTLGNVTTTSVTYTAPATLPSPATVTLTATSKSDGTKSNTATITLTAASAIVVTVSPTTASVSTSATRNFTVTVQNDAQNKGVTWSLAGAGCSGTSCGTLSNVTTTSVTYNAPASAPNPATVTLTATSVADGTKSGAATITVTAVSTNITVSVSPQRGGLVASQTLAISATLTNDTGNAGVTWSTTGGSFPTMNSTGATFMAPATPGVVTITATSVTDPSKTATATIGVTNLSGMTTYLGGNTRQGGNTQEYALATSGVTAVNASNFGKLFSCAVDAPIYAQPLWVAQMTISGGTRNVVFVATAHDSVYAFDADANPCTQLWRASLIDTAHGAASSSETWVSSVDNDCTNISPDIGIVGTPVIDLNTQTLYVVSKSKNASSTIFYQRIHALDLTTGNEKFSGPKNITASVLGTGVGSSGNPPQLPFDPLGSNQRPALLLTNGHVIVDWASHCDNMRFTAGSCPTAPLRWLRKRCSAPLRTASTPEYGCLEAGRRPIRAATSIW